MKKILFKEMKGLFYAFIILLCTSWGFYAHKEINKMAVFTLPQPLMSFFKKHIIFITEQAVNPDKRRYVVTGEAPKHYLDVEFYGDSIFTERPDWKLAIDRYTEDSLQAHGSLPWNLIRLTYRLQEAFKLSDAKTILKLSADMGHYIGDLHVPLHTTKNYNGQLTGQHGIHGLWESRLPELYAGTYSYYLGKADYITDIPDAIWNALKASNNGVDSVLSIEKKLQKQFKEDRIFSYEERNGQTVRVYSEDFSKAYHKALNDMVQRRMRAAIKMTGDLWYTCWVNAGKPAPENFHELVFTQEEISEMEKEEKSAGSQDCSH